MAEDQAASKRAPGSRAADRVLRVAEFLATGDILAWKPMRAIAKALELGEAETYGALENLAARGWAEKSEHGYRQSANGLSFYAVQAQEAVAKAVYQCGFRK